MDEVQWNGKHIACGFAVFAPRAIMRDMHWNGKHITCGFAVFAPHRSFPPALRFRPAPLS